MQILETALAGVHRICSEPHTDARGWFSRLHCSRELQAAGIPAFELVQANWSHTYPRGAFRGLHFQEPPHLETKIVRCVRGAVLDIVVDLRADSPTFLQVHTEELADVDTALLLPRGCAHGFQVLSEEADLLYLHDAAYEASAARSIHVDSPVLGIRLPLPIRSISDRDRNARRIDADFTGIRS
jgi:dTDP-4-dehydrorhamnose 3,5-epimerase